MKPVQLLWLPALLLACSHEAPVNEWQCDNRTTGLGSWATMSLPSAELGSKSTAYAWTDSGLIVWGGNGINESARCVPCGAGAIFDPQTNAWQPMSTEGAPIARSSVPGVWTGERFIIWGGWRKNWRMLESEETAVFAYDPATDRWETLETSNPPEWRMDHTAVWTGEALLIWGGASEDDNTFYRNGAALDLDTRRWRRISTEGAAEARDGFPTIWTGTELIVWGGWGGEVRGESYTVGTGAIYNPTTDTWRPMSTEDAPSPRVGHRGVWTGEEMLITGGSEFKSGLKFDAFAYNPATDSWRKVSSAGAPGIVDSMVWTGTEVIAWGGDTTCFIGARYNPTEDLWQPMTPVNAPVNRVRSIAAWTGEFLIVYGGSFGPEARFDTVSGGIYFP